MQVLYLANDLRNTGKEVSVEHRPQSNSGGRGSVLRGLLSGLYPPTPISHWVRSAPRGH